MRNKIVLRLWTLYCLILEMRNWWLPIMCALNISRGNGIAIFRDGDRLKISEDDWKGIPSICRLKRKFRVSVIVKDSRILLEFKNDVKFLLSKDSLFWELGVINEVWDWDDYQLNNRDLTGMKVIDIGGYIGDSALLFASLGANVDVFEPFPIAYNTIKENIRLSGEVGKKVTLHPVGLSVEDKETEVLYDSTKISFANTDEKTGGDVETIRLVDTESYLRDKGINGVDILKIDCEGCEYDLLLKTNLLKITKPKEIMLEYHSGYVELKAFLEKQSYLVRQEGGAELGLMFALLK